MVQAIEKKAVSMVDMQWIRGGRKRSYSLYALNKPLDAKLG